MGRQRAHTHVFARGVAGHNFGQPCTQPGRHRIDVLARNNGTADGGAFLARLGRHLACNFLDEKLELFIVRRHVGGEDGAVQRVGFGVERDGLAHQVRVHTQFCRCVRRTGERDHVRPLQPVEQVTCAANDQLQAALWQDAGRHHQPYCGFGQVAGGRSRFANTRHTRQKARCKFLKQPPHREIESVDMHRNTRTRHQDVGACKVAFFAQGHSGAFMHQVARRQLIAAHRRIREQRARTTFNVDPTVGAGGTGMGRDGVELFLVFVQVFGQRLQALGALLEVQRHQTWKPHRACVVQGLGEIQCLGMGV